MKFKKCQSSKYLDWSVGKDCLSVGTSVCVKMKVT